MAFGFVDDLDDFERVFERKGAALYIRSPHSARPSFIAFRSGSLLNICILRVLFGVGISIVFAEKIEPVNRNNRQVWSPKKH